MDLLDSRASIDREVARNLPVPLGHIREYIEQMFWAPDALAGSTAERVKQLSIDNLQWLLVMLAKRIAYTNINDIA